MVFCKKNNTPRLWEEGLKVEKNLRVALVMLLAVLAGCQGSVPVRSAEEAPGGPAAGREAASHSTLLIDAGLKHFGAGEYDKARIHFDAVLKLDPLNAVAHFLVAEVYRQRAESGDRAAAALAEVGYQQALALEQSYWPAAAGLGQTYLRERRYGEAQEQFARAVMYRPQDPAMLYRLAVASYYNHDMRTALPAIREAQRLAPGNAYLQPAVAIVSAAAGDVDAARLAVSRIGDALPLRERDRIIERVEDWNAFRSSPQVLTLAQNSTDQSAPSPSAVQPLPAPKPSADGKPLRMVQVDVIMIRTEEVEASGRGVNVLDGLMLQYGGSGTRTDTRARDATGDMNSVQRVITRAINVPNVMYSLNIANDSLDYASVVARPTLVASDGQPATFFSGESVSLALSGNFAGNIQDRDIGVSLAVTPTFLDDDRVLLNVSATRSFVNFGNPAVTGSFQQALQTTKQAVTTSVAVRFGETLILSGLSERQIERQRSAAPLLGDLPLIQYLFNRSDQSVYTKSVLMLLTPRRVDSATDAGPTHNIDTPHGQALKRLHTQFPQLFSAPLNLDVIRQGVQRNVILSPMRPRDLPADPEPGAHEPRSLEKRLRDLIYY